MDLNDDGNIDLLGEGYAGFTYVLWGQKDGSFKKAVILKDKSGKDIHLGSYYDLKKHEYIGNFFKSGDKGYFAKAHDWDGDGDLDLVISGFNGAWLRLNEGSKKKPAFATENIHIIKKHYADVFVDWDGDGLWDIIGGDKDGGVYFYKNIGKKRKPAFGEAVCLLSPEEFANKEYGGFGMASQVDVADYNHDGKLDLIVGTKNMVPIAGTEFTNEELNKEHKKIEAQSKEITKKVFTERKKIKDRYQKKFGENYMKEMNKDKDHKKLMDTFSKFSKRYNTFYSQYKSHGFVFVSLQK